MTVTDKYSRKIRVIDGTAPHLFHYLKNVWTYRRLILTLVNRDLKIKYAQTFLGLLWTILQPLTGLIVFTIFFDKLIQVDTGNTPYPLFAFSGLLAWYFFSYTINAGSHVLVESGELIKKVYFPKLILPISKMFLGLVDLIIGLLLIIPLMLFFKLSIGFHILLLPVLVLLNALVGLSIAIWLSALTVKYRDFIHIVPYLINFGIWLTPVFYPTTLIPDAYRFLMYANPMAAIIAGYRWVLLGGEIPNIYYLLSFLPVFILLFSGLLYFRKIEDDIADFI